MSEKPARERFVEAMQPIVYRAINSIMPKVTRNGLLSDLRQAVEAFADAIALRNLKQINLRKADE